MAPTFYIPLSFHCVIHSEGAAYISVFSQKAKEVFIVGYHTIYIGNVQSRDMLKYLLLVLSKAAYVLLVNSGILAHLYVCGAVKERPRIRAKTGKQRSNVSRATWLS